MCRARGPGRPCAHICQKRPLDVRCQQPHPAHLASGPGAAAGAGATGARARAQGRGDCDGGGAGMTESQGEKWPKVAETQSYLSSINHVFILMGYLLFFLMLFVPITYKSVKAMLLLVNIICQLSLISPTLVRFIFIVMCCYGRYL